MENLTDPTLLAELSKCSDRERAAIVALFKGQVSDLAKAALRKIKAGLKRQARKGR